MRERTGIMLAYKFDPKRLSRLSLPYITQPKLNGDRCRAVFSPSGEVTLLSSTAREILSVPHINRALEHLGLKNLELDGELYIHGMSHQQIRSIASKRVTLHPEYLKMQYHVYDLVSPEPQLARLETLQKINTKEVSDHIKLVPAWYLTNLDQIKSTYTSLLNSGYEGVVIRDPNSPYIRKQTTKLLKLKPRLSMTCTITGFEEEHTITGEPKGTLGSLQVQDTEGNTFHVGTGFTQRQRLNMWQIKDTLKGQKAKIRYQELSDDMIPKMASFDCLIN